MAVTFVSMMHYEINRGGAGLHLPHNIIIWAMMALLVIVLYWPQSAEARSVNAPSNLWLLCGALLLTLPGLWPASLQHIGAWLPRVLSLWGDNTAARAVSAETKSQCTTSVVTVNTVVGLGPGYTGFTAMVCFYSR